MALLKVAMCWSPVFVSRIFSPRGKSLTTKTNNDMKLNSSTELWRAISRGLFHNWFCVLKVRGNKQYSVTFCNLKFRLI